MPPPNGGMITSSKRKSEVNPLRCLTLSSYDGLKKQIYLIEKQQSGLDATPHGLESQHSPSLGNSDADKIFTQYLNRELREIIIFYESQGADIFEDIEDLEAQVAEQEEAEIRIYSEFDGGREREEETALQPGKVSEPREQGVFTQSVSSAQLPETVWTSDTDYCWDIRLLFKRRIANLYISASSLKSYVELNYSGFRKILKK